MKACCPRCGLDVAGIFSADSAWWVECRSCGCGFSGKSNDVMELRVENHIGMKFWVPIGCLMVMCEESL